MQQRFSLPKRPMKIAALDDTDRESSTRAEYRSTEVLSTEYIGREPEIFSASVVRRLETVNAIVGLIYVTSSGGPESRDGTLVIGLCCLLSGPLKDSGYN